jgi:hypothetical protein
MEVSKPYHALQNSHRHMKEFFEIYRQLGNAHSESSTSPALQANLLHVQWELPQ